MQFLQRMLDDRLPGIKSVQEIGSELAKRGDLAEKKQVEEQLKDLNERWDKLTQAADDRKQALEKSMELAKIFHDKLEPFVEWTDNMEKKISGMEPPATEPQKIKQQKEDQRAIGRALEEKKAELDEVLLSGQELLKQSTGEEQDKVRDMIENMKERYGDLLDKSDSRLQALEEALPLSEQVQEAHEKFHEQIQQIESELRGKEPVGPEAEEQVQVSSKQYRSC